MKKIADILYKQPFFLLLLFLLIAYLPVFLPYFHLKNDLISQNLPTRFVISESLYSGYFPWWNPYINFGIPQYGDMNNGFWNPFLWCIAGTSGYNIWTITYEEMFYVLAGGWGIYKVVKELGIQKTIAIIIAISYMSCGYITGHLQFFCWITGVAFFPYVLLYFLRINKSPTIKNYLLGAFAVFLFVSSTHPGLIIGAAYFFLFAVIIIFFFRKTYAKAFYLPKFLLINLVYLLFGMLFSVGVIISDIDVLLHISRGSIVSLGASLLAPTTYPSYLSLLFPVAVNKSSFFATDIAMRNVFAGLPAIIGFLVMFRHAHKKFIGVVLLALVFFVLLAAGGFFKTIAYYTLPFTGFVRLNGEFAYFIVLILLLAGAWGLAMLSGDEQKETRWNRMIFFLKIVCVSTIVVSVFSIMIFRDSIIYNPVVGTGHSKFAIKHILDEVRFSDLLLLSSVIQLVTFLLFAKNFNSLKKIAWLTALNMLVNTWFSLPFTGLGMESKSELHHKMFVPPRGLPTQALLPISKTAFIDSTLKKEFILLGAYSRKIGYPEQEQYPVVLKNSEVFFNDSILHRFINNQSYVFFSSDTTIYSATNTDTSFIRINRSGPGHLNLTVTNPGYKFMTFLQNDYPYWHTFINGKIVPHFTGFRTFITIQVEKGKQEIEFKFDPSPIKKAMLLNLLFILAGLFALLFPRFRYRLVIS